MDLSPFKDFTGIVKQHTQKKKGTDKHQCSLVIDEFWSIHGKFNTIQMKCGSDIRTLQPEQWSKLHKLREVYSKEINTKSEKMCELYKPVFLKSLKVEHVPFFHWAL